MIEGKFDSGHPWLPLVIEGQDGRVDIDFLLDTGFDGDISVSPSVAFRLYSGEFSPTYRKMADGHRTLCPSFELTVQWNDVGKVVEVIVLPGRPLVGTDFLHGCTMHAELWQGGAVEIELPE